MGRGLTALALAFAAAACLPPPRCGSIANIDMWRKEDRPPGFADNELSWWKTGCARADRRVATTVHVAAPMPNTPAKGADVFFMPASSYAAWLMTHATANAVKGLPIAVDPTVLRSYSKQAIADADGNADLGSNYPGLYVAFTVYDVISGDLTPNRDVFVYERVVELTKTTGHIELTPTRHVLNPPSTPVPPTLKGTPVDIRRTYDAR